MGLTDYGNRDERIQSNGDKYITTHEPGKTGYDNGYHTRLVYDSNKNLKSGSVYGGPLYGGYTHDNHSHYEYGKGDGRDVLRSDIYK